MFPHSQQQVSTRNLVLLIALYMLWSHYFYALSYKYPFVLTGFTPLGVWTTDES